MIDIGLDHDDLDLPENYEGMLEVIPSFIFPDATSSGPYHFYGVVFKDGMLDVPSVISNIAIAEFYIGNTP